MKVAFDSNVLLYAFGGGDDAKRDRASHLLDALAVEDVCLPGQTAGEVFNVATRKLKRPVHEVIDYIVVLEDTFGFANHDSDRLMEAIALAARHRLQIWDALILCVSAGAGSALLLSEDMQDGFVYRGTTVANPFAATPHPLFASLLQSLPEFPE